MEPSPQTQTTPIPNYTTIQQSLFCEADISKRVIDHFDLCLNDIAVCRMLMQTVMFENRHKGDRTFEMFWR